MLLSRNALKNLFARKFGLPIVMLVNRLGISPNLLTIFGIVIACASAYLSSIGQLWGSGLILLFSSVFDLLDGTLARVTGRVTLFGALLDSSMDRISEAVVLFGLLLLYLETNQSSGIVLVFLTLACSFMVSYVRARSEGLRIECTVGILTRTERIVLMVIGLIVGHWLPVFLLIVLALIVTLSVITTGHRLVHSSTNMRNAK